MRHWDLTTGELRHEFKASGHAVLSVAFSPDGKRAVASHRGSDHPVRVWDLEGKYAAVEITIADLKVTHTSPIRTAFGHLPSLVYAWDTHRHLLAWDFVAQERYTAAMNSPKGGNNIISDDMRFALVVDAFTPNGGPNVKLLRLPRISDPKDKGELQDLTAKLGATDHKTREEATEALARVPGQAYALVRDAASSRDPEVSERAKQIMHVCRMFRAPQELGTGLVAPCPIQGMGAAIDTESGLWAAIRKTGNSDSIATGFVVGSFSTTTGDLKLIRQFDTDENPHLLRFVPGNGGLLVANKDGTITRYGSPL